MIPFCESLNICGDGQLTTWFRQRPELRLARSVHAAVYPGTGSKILSSILIDSDICSPRDTPEQEIYKLQFASYMATSEILATHLSGSPKSSNHNCIVYTSISCSLFFSSDQSSVMLLDAHFQRMLGKGEMLSILVLSEEDDATVSFVASHIFSLS